MNVTILPAGPDDLDEVRRLFRAYAEGIGVDLGFQGFQAELAALPGKYAPPGGLILLARDSARPDAPALGCVAMRPIAEGEVEMKRLYLTPGARGLGLGDRLARAIIEAAKAAGYRRMRLDTLASMAPALGLYRRLGFAETPAYYDNPLPGAVYLALDLSAEPAGVAR